MTAPRNPAGPVGYAWLRDTFGAPDFLGGREARLASVTSLDRRPDGSLLVPRVMDPLDSILEHVLFALKYEDRNLHLLSLALRNIDGKELEEAYRNTPNGAYIRMACYFWEQINQKELSQAGDGITAPYLRFFDPDLYATGASRRSPKWRVDFNGLGDVHFCPVVRLTPEIKQMLADDVLAQARAFAQEKKGEMLDRALRWAYLSETEGSFAIEGVVPSKGKAEAFVRLLQHASDPRSLSEEYLCSLQNVAIEDPLNREYQFRTQQNRLQRGRGAAGVSYVPPPPEMVEGLMAGILELANNPRSEIPALIHAAVVSFGFVLIHPFMDGNGRLSRYLVHHCLGQSGLLPEAFVLPMSVAMKRNESDYLSALTSFSKPAREFCNVTWLGGSDYVYDWAKDHDLAFRYMDVTEGAAFILRMAHDSLRHDLHLETKWLADFDSIYKTINERYDIRNDHLADLIVFALDQEGRLSINRRKQYADRVSTEVLDAIETQAMKCLEAGEHGSEIPAAPFPRRVRPR